MDVDEIVIHDRSRKILRDAGIFTAEDLIKLGLPKIRKLGLSRASIDSILFCLFDMVSEKAIIYTKDFDDFWSRNIAIDKSEYQLLIDKASKYDKICDVTKEK